MMKHSILLLLLCVSCAAAEATHPYMLLTSSDVTDIRDKIEEHDWAAHLLEKMKAYVVAKDERHELQAAILYQITGERRYADMAIPKILNRSYGITGGYAWDLGWGEALMYDLVYDAMTPVQREQVEAKMAEGGRQTIEAANKQRQTWNMFFMLHAQVAILGYAIGDEELIEWGMNDPGGGSFETYEPGKYGGYYQVMESCVQDSTWHEPNIYQFYLGLPAMVMLAEAARNYAGIDLWQWQSPSGDSLTDLFVAPLDRLYPAEELGIDHGSFRLTSYGDTSTQFRDHTDDAGINSDTFLVNAPHPPAGGASKRRWDLGALYEIAYRRTGDPRFAWVISRNPSRDWSQRTVRYHLAFAFAGLTHGLPVDMEAVTPPPAASRVSPNASFAMLRADESADYWYGNGLACFFMMGDTPWRSHAHADCYQILLHGYGRLLYPDIDVMQYEDDKALGWTRRSIAHNTLIVDGANTQANLGYEHSSDFNPDVKFIVATGAPYEKPNTQFGTAGIGDQAYPKNAHLGRALFLTRDYLADFFWVTSSRSHVYDWALHGIGELFHDGRSYRLDERLPASDDLAPYKWIRDVRRIDGAADWQVDWLQHFATPRRGVGVRLRMLGAPGTTTYLGEGPLYQSDLANSDTDPTGNHMKVRPAGPVSRLPMVVARRTARNAIFAALHEPYEADDADQPNTVTTIRGYHLIGRTDDAIAVRITGDGFTDYCMAAFTPDPKITQAVPVPGTVIDTLDEGWTFHLDPDGAGENSGWFRPEFKAAGWQPIRTDQIWEQQGYADYNGVGWYRTHFTLPAGLEDKKLYLHFGGVDEEPKVWLNGKLMGERRGVEFWDDPWHVEITPAAVPGAENTLVVRVFDSTHAGGIYKPVTVVHSILSAKESDDNDGTVTLASDDGTTSFTFAEYAYLRVAGQKVIARGGLQQFSIPADGELTLNGQPATVTDDNGVMKWGE